MNHVTDIREAGRDASVLTDAGSGGLIGRGILSEGALADHLGDDETPRYVLRNRKHGVTVEGPEETDEYAPDRSHSGAAVVSDVRVLFAAGRSDDDRTLSVSLADVVDVRTEDGLIGGALVVETVDDERYRFPCRGDLEPVREYVDAAVGVWTRAQRHVEEAREQVDRSRSAFESGNADVVLAATGDVEATLADAREAADALDGARARVDDRAGDVREELAALERRAYAEYAEQARERAHVRWDDRDYEAAMDNVDEASEAYAAAREIDATEPDDDLLAERCETLAEERERLSVTPVDRAEHAVDVAAAADDPRSAADWWETALERYETALSLDWGRDDRRFAGEPGTLRDDLADAARELVAAHCEHAREHIADGDEVRDADAGRAADAYDRAADAVTAAREVTRERVPEATDDVDAVAAALEDRLETLPEREAPEEAKLDGGRTATTTRPSNGESETDDDGQVESETDDDGPVEGETDEDGPVDTETDENGPSRDDVTADAETSEVTGAADGTGDSVESADSTGADSTGADSTGSGSTGSGDATGEDDETPATAGSDPLEETRTVIGEPGAEPTDTDGPEAEAERVTDPAAVGADALPSLVARVFESAGWSTTVFGAGTGDRYDLLAATDGPVSVTVCVWTVHPETVETVDAATVGRYASYFDGVEEADAAALCSVAPMSETARARAADSGFELVDEDALREHLEGFALDPREF